MIRPAAEDVEQACVLVAEAGPPKHQPGAWGVAHRCAWVLASEVRELQLDLKESRRAYHATMAKHQAAETLVFELRQKLPSCRDAREGLNTALQVFVDTEVNHDQLTTQIAAVRRVHPCTGAECEVCSVLDCPVAEPLHHHHDGCPECDAKETP